MIRNNVLSNSVYDLCVEYGNESLGYEMALCASELQSDKYTKKEKLNNLYYYLKGIDKELYYYLYELMRPYVK